MTRDHLRRWICGLRGHDLTRHYDPDRIFHRCVTCGYESPGWQLNAPPPTLRHPIVSSLSTPARKGFQR